MPMPKSATATSTRPVFGKYCARAVPPTRSVAWRIHLQPLKKLGSSLSGRLVGILIVDAPM
jgi:hypothetical protein